MVLSGGGEGLDNLLELEHSITLDILELFVDISSKKKVS